MRGNLRTPGWTRRTGTAASREKDANTTVIAGPGGEPLSSWNVSDDEWFTLLFFFWGGAFVDFSAGDKAVLYSKNSSGAWLSVRKTELISIFWCGECKQSYQVGPSGEIQTCCEEFHTVSFRSFHSPAPWTKNSPSHTENSFQASYSLRWEESIQAGFFSFSLRNLSINLTPSKPFAVPQQGKAASDM